MSDLAQNAPSTPHDFAAYYGPKPSDPEAPIRAQVFDQDIGQRSWTHVRDLERFSQLLMVHGDSHLLDYGCGYGGPALWFATRWRCEVTGIDVNAPALECAAAQCALSEIPPRVTFQQVGAKPEIPLSSTSIDAVLMNDVICHLPDREKALRECHRVMKPGALILITDPLVVSGPISNSEVVARNMRVEYFYAPEGYNEQLLSQCGFRVQLIEDTTDRLISMALAHLELRPRYRDELIAAEGAAAFERTMAQLTCVFECARTHRLTRFLYLAEKRR